MEFCKKCGGSGMIQGSGDFEVIYCYACGGRGMSKEDFDKTMNGSFKIGYTCDGCKKKTEYPVSSSNGKPALCSECRKEKIKDIKFTKHDGVDSVFDLKGDK